MVAKKPNVVFAADGDNECVSAVRTYLQENTNLTSPDPALPWPSLARAAAEQVSSGNSDVGILMCWTGTGTAIAANKVKGIRAAQASEPWIARGARLWNDANVLTMSLKRTAPDIAVECVQAFLETTEIDAEEVENIRLLGSFDE